MIHFSRKPDAVFRRIVEESLEMAADEIRMYIDVRGGGPWTDCFPLFPRCFAPESAAGEVHRLLEASRDQRIYRITDYHWLILHDCILNYCELFNDIAREKPDDFPFLEGLGVRRIDFEGLIELYFWDTDFLFQPGELERLGAGKRREMGISDEALWVALGAAPHPDELLFELVSHPAWHDDDPQELFRPGSKSYPDPRWED